MSVALAGLQSRHSLIANGGRQFAGSKPAAIEMSGPQKPAFQNNGPSQKFG